MSTFFHRAPSKGPLVIKQKIPDDGNFDGNWGSKEFVQPQCDQNRETGNIYNHPGNTHDGELNKRPAVLKTNPNDVKDKLNYIPDPQLGSAPRPIDKVNRYFLYTRAV